MSIEVVLLIYKQLKFILDKPRWKKFSISYIIYVSIFELFIT